MFSIVYQHIVSRKRYKSWRVSNANNDTAPMNDFDQSLVTVGNQTYGGIRVYNFNCNSRLQIGSFCSIADDVMFVLNADHRIDTISTFPYKVKCLKTDIYEAETKGDIVVDDDVWIGYHATVLSGVHIGQGAIIAAGAVVTKNVLPYAIVGGVPAKVIRYRFSNTVIEELLRLDYSSLTKEMIESHIKELYAPIDDLNIDELRRLFNWFPKKD